MYMVLNMELIVEKMAVQLDHHLVPAKELESLMVKLRIGN